MKKKHKSSYQKLKSRYDELWELYVELREGRDCGISSNHYLIGNEERLEFPKKGKMKEMNTDNTWDLKDTGVIRLPRGERFVSYIKIKKRMYVLSNKAMYEIIPKHKKKARR